MPPSVAISFNRVTKTYPSYYHVRGGIKTFLFNLAASLRELRQRTLALENITLDIRHGETFGFIGRNGAGKSTTLGLIAGVLFPDSGTITVNGRVSPLLELGAGFHPELTGRENIRLNGVLMGLRAHEVEEQLDEIIEFSTLGTFIDQPVRTYSSGMYAKLGFSVVATLRPEILLIDEILSVGDYAFTMRCTERMEKFRADPDVTMVLVSHTLESVSAICDRAAWIEDHRIRMIGPAEDVVRAYTEASDQTIKSFVPEQLGQMPPYLVPSAEQIYCWNGQARLDVTACCAAEGLHLLVIIYAADNTSVVQRWDITLAGNVLHLMFHHDGALFSLSAEDEDIPGLAEPGQAGDGAAAPAAEAPLTLELVLANAQGERVSMPATLPLSVSHEARKQHESRRYAALSAARPCPQHGTAPGFRSPLQAPLWTTRRTFRIVARSIFPRDAVGQFALDTAGFFLSAGVDVRPYAHVYPIELSGIVHPVGRLQHETRPEDILIYNYSVEDEFLQLIAGLPCKKVLYYHGVAPGALFRPYDPDFADLLDRSRGQFARFNAFDAALANSRSSLDELEGFLKEGIFKAHCPPLLAPTIMEAASADATEHLPVTTGDSLLWVGRMAPHKRPDFALALFASLAEALPGCSLVLVGGGHNSCPAFGERLETLRAGLPEGIRRRVHFQSGLSPAALHTLYAKASALLCTSLHEGFCIPLYEAMRCGTPVFATPQAAVEATLGGAGLLLADDPLQAAAECAAALNSPETMARLRQKGRIRGEELAAAARGERLWGAVAAALSRK